MQSNAIKIFQNQHCANIALVIDTHHWAGNVAVAMMGELIIKEHESVNWKNWPAWFGLGADKDTVSLTLP